MKWHYTFLLANARLREDDVEELLWEATRMFLQKRRRKSVRGTNWEGVLTTKREVGSLGPFSGQKFIGEVDTKKGKVHVVFLMNDGQGQGAAEFIPEPSLN